MNQNKVNNYILLANKLIDNFVINKKLVSIKEMKNNNYDHYLVILVNKQDMESLTKNKCSLQKSITNILKAYAYKNNEKIKIEFDSF